MTLDHNFIKSLPKAELHCHLDGSLRIETIIDLAKEQNVTLPTDNAKKLTKLLAAGPDCKSLEEYLEPFKTTCAVLQTEEALMRATYELAEDCSKENVRYLEVRFSPILHIEKGLNLSQVVEAVIEGKKKAEKDFNIIVGIIICGLRHTTPSISLELAELAVAYKNRGVIGFDLAGAEEGFPAKDHKESFYLIINNNINTTAHAGEAYGPESIHQALHYISANRIGHGTTLRENGDLLNYVNDHRIPLEICISSNVQTKAVSSYKNHPVKFYYDMGLVVTINTDNRLISGKTLTDEFVLAIEKFGFNEADLGKLILNAFKAAFIPYKEKVSLIKSISKELQEKGISVPKVII
jgi:adenosine deaminase